jgi:outer membrane protein assembly factor BamA
MRLLSFILLLVQTVFLTAQNQPTSAIIRDFVFDGNSKTKASSLMREFTIHVGDTIPLSNLAIKLEENRLRMLNTGLFTVVKINVKNWSTDDKVTVAISVVERWYFYPVPIIELADRDLNVWWKDYHHDIRRTNYGIRLTHSNITGRRDPFSSLIQFGYTPKFSLGYAFPAINKKQTFGAFIGYFYATNREVGYATVNNKIVDYKNPTENIFTRLSTNFGLSYVPGLYHRHLWNMGYSKQTLDTSVTERLNRDYFLDSRTKQSYFWFTYDYSNDFRDFRPYPMKGHAMSINIAKSGFFKKDDVNALDIRFRYAQYFKLNKYFSLETILRGKTKLIRKAQPYNFQQGMGYGSDFVRGYELFVVDGFDFGILKNSLRLQMLDKEYDLSSYLKPKIFKSLQSLPVKMFLTANLDMGYSYTPQYNPLNNFQNRLLYGGGIGLDILAYQGMLWQFEYSFNHTGQGGFYVHYKAGF